MSNTGRFAVMLVVGSLTTVGALYWLLSRAAHAVTELAVGG